MALAPLSGAPKPLNSGLLASRSAGTVLTMPGVSGHCETSSLKFSLAMPNLPYEDPEERERSGMGTWFLVFLGAVAFFSVLYFFGTRW